MRGPRSLAMAFGLMFGLSPAANVTKGTGSVEGTVRERGGGPLSGAIVSIIGSTFSTTTDRRGHYHLAGVPTGNARVQVTMPGFSATTHEVVVLEGKATTADFTLSPSALRDEQALPAPTAPISRMAKSAAAESYRVMGSLSRARQDFNTEEYKYFADNSWQSPGSRPLSTFAIDVDAGSYSNMRRFIREGRLPPKDAVRVEEMINYFRYDYPEPRDNHPVSITTELAPAPWRSGHLLARIGLATRRLSLGQLPPNNLVFLLDVSGSMDMPSKLPLVKSAFRLLVNELRSEDRVAIVVYAGNAGLVLPSTPGTDKERILDAIERLEAGGSTAGGAGIQLAYKVAREHFDREANNRVILATDGDFNVGASSDGELVRMIEERRQDGIFLTVLGFGTGNLKDAKMEQLANKGNGHYAYVDDLLEAKKVFVQELGATLYTVAKDVKIQVEFNPGRVRAYRLVGYENRLLEDRDFNDDAKDAGEMGAGHTVTALYELVPVGSESDVRVGSVDPLKYQRQRGESAGSDDWLTVKVRYKLPTSSTSQLLERVVRQEAESPSVDFRFASAVASFGMLLRDSEYKGRSSYNGVLTLARSAKGRDDEGYRAEFIRLVEMAAGLAGKERELTDR